jgi:hypothetical protein
VKIEIEKQKTKITNDNPTTVYYHTPHLWKRIQWHIQRDSERSVLATEWRQTHSLNGTDTTHLLVCAQHSPTIFLLKKIKKSTWKHQKPHDLVITQKLKTVWKFKNTHECKLYFLDGQIHIFHCTWITGKKTLLPNIFLIPG